MLFVKLQRVKEFGRGFGLSKRLSLHDLFPILVIIPTVVFYLIDPKSFGYDWYGYTVFAYASFFILLVWLLGRLNTKPTDNVRWTCAAFSVAMILLYQYLVYSLGLLQSILSLGQSLGLESMWLTNQWRVSIDIAAFLIYQIALAISFFSLSAFRRFSVPIIYLLLSISALLLDAFHPVASFVAFQIFIPYIVVCVTGLLRIFGLNSQYSFFYDPRGYMRSIMVIPDPPRAPLAIDIYWQCAGILSMLIYFAVIYSLLATLKISKLRKTIYLTIGLLGTIFMNILRIAAIIILYVYMKADLGILHQNLGGVLFIAWITLFLSIIFLVEKRNPYVPSGVQPSKLSSTARAPQRCASRYAMSARESKLAPELRFVCLRVHVKGKCLSYMFLYA
jgi:thaumarchaeosortase